MHVRILSLLLALLPAMFGQAAKNVMVVSAGGGDYIAGAGGTLAKLIGEGYTVVVLQVGNDEKNSVGLTPAETRLKNNEEGARAARILGVKEIVHLSHKAGELSQVSSNEMRNQIFAMIRLFKPVKIFHPDPFIHYQPDWDQFFAARAAEESSYGSSSLFGPDLTRMGFPGYGVPETYYYVPHRPYRPGEGGHNAAKFVSVDIGATFAKKAEALRALETGNVRYATQVKQRLEAAGKGTAMLGTVNAESAGKLMTAWAEELAETIGAKHGFQYGEEFNYHGRGAAVPEHVREKARPVK